MAQDGIVNDMRETIAKLTQTLASSDTEAFCKIPGSCCKACPEVSRMACWEGK